MGKSGGKATHNTGGGSVADYFAILGVGSTLVPKSSSSSAISSDPISTDALKAEERLKEEECAMTERFYREIVEVALLSIEGDDGRIVRKNEDQHRKNVYTPANNNTMSGNGDTMDASSSSPTSMSVAGKKGSTSLGFGTNSSSSLENTTHHSNINNNQMSDNESASNGASLFNDAEGNESRGDVLEVEFKGTLATSFTGNNTNEEDYLQNKTLSNALTTHISSQVTICAGAKIKRSQQSPHFAKESVEMLPPAEVQGFKIIWNTSPANRSSSDTTDNRSNNDTNVSMNTIPLQDTSISTDPNLSMSMLNTSNLDDTFTSIHNHVVNNHNSSNKNNNEPHVHLNMDMDYNSTNNLHTSTPTATWDKDSIMDANLHPFTGLRSKLLSKKNHDQLHQSDLHAGEYETSSHPSLPMTENSLNASSHTSVDTNTNYANEGMASRLRRKIAPILSSVANSRDQQNASENKHNLSVNSVGNSYKNHTEYPVFEWGIGGIDANPTTIQIPKTNDNKSKYKTNTNASHFQAAYDNYSETTASRNSKTRYYLGYRRRGADESHLPAMADVTLCYVRIHTDTIWDTNADADTDTNRNVLKETEGRKPSTFPTSIHEENEGGEVHKGGEKNVGKKYDDEDSNSSQSNSNKRLASLSSSAALGIGTGARIGAAALRRGFVVGAGAVRGVARSVGAGRKLLKEDESTIKPSVNDDDFGDDHEEIDEKQDGEENNILDNLSLSQSQSQTSVLSKSHNQLQSHSNLLSSGGIKHTFNSSEKESTSLDKKDTEKSHANGGDTYKPCGNKNTLNRFGCTTPHQSQQYKEVRLEDYLILPEGYHEWVIPDSYHKLRIPLYNKKLQQQHGSPFPLLRADPSSIIPPVSSPNGLPMGSPAVRRRKTFLFPHRPSPTNAGMGVEAYFMGTGSGSGSTSQNSSFDFASPKYHNSHNGHTVYTDKDVNHAAHTSWSASVPASTFVKGDDVVFDKSNFGKNYPDSKLFPTMVPTISLPSPNTYNDAQHENEQKDSYEYVPILAVRRQMVGEEERFHEDPAATDLSLSFLDNYGEPVLPTDDVNNDIDAMLDEMDEEEEEEAMLGRTGWGLSHVQESSSTYPSFPDFFPTDSLFSSPLDDSFEQNPDVHHPKLSQYHPTQSTNEYIYDNNRQNQDAKNHMHSLPIPLATTIVAGTPSIILRKNKPTGFADMRFSTSVLDRFPTKDYSGVPLPQEELPMFCYPTGCRLFRAMYRDAPLAETYGFVVKNERGDSIHVSCVSFMEPLTMKKIQQLDEMSGRRMKTSLPHRFFCEKRRELKRNEGKSQNTSKNQFTNGHEQTNDLEKYNDSALTNFDKMTTFENKTLCLISRYPYWRAFRRFLSHLHVLSGSVSDLPLERSISHLLLTVPVPKPGGPCVIVPLPALSSGLMALSAPPAKDLPLVDLSFRRLFMCLDVPTVVTIVLSFLALEKKIIVMSTYPSLVSDACELLRSLLFPFELCAPYVPRLTEPFVSCLEFPGAIFVGIHDDGCDDGLAAAVRKTIPDDSAIVDLDTGDVDCNGDRYAFLKECWDIIPSDPRTILVSEVELLCQDAGIVPGQEPMGLEIEAAFDAADDDGLQQELDDRAIRDCFLRFFCSMMGGYERFLVVPDIDFLISGNEWFNTAGFLEGSSLAARRNNLEDKTPYLRCLVETQLFQSFIQRRTEASDVRCLFFDECISEFYATKIPFGRLHGESVLADNNEPLVYDLLVDQCAADPFDFNETDVEASSSAETSFLTSTTTTVATTAITTTETDGCESTVAINSTGDIVTSPSIVGLVPSRRYVYCVDGKPCFPQQLNREYFYPVEPEHLCADFGEIPVPILTRSDRERDESKLRLKMAVSRRGVQRQRRCLFQLPKLMGSHVLGTWLMCIPSQVSQTHLTLEQRARYLLRALGALRLLRSRHRIVPDEAGYRCLIVSCGRAGSDRRTELVQLFGLLRSDGIFPSAVTLGQYTRAIAEGFSKRSSGSIENGDNDTSGVETVVNGGVYINLSNAELYSALNILDQDIKELENSGKKWRQKPDSSNIGKSDRNRIQNQERINDIIEENTGKKSSPTIVNKKGQTKKSQSKSWLPVMSSSSFSPWKTSMSNDYSNTISDFKFFSLWSRVVNCPACSYAPLDEEIQCGWDGADENYETTNAVPCPRCGAMIQPKIGYKEISIQESMNDILLRNESGKTEQCVLPPQLKQTILESDNTGSSSSLGFVPYLKPSKLRLALERLVEEYGEEILDREKLREFDPTIFFNLWWFSARLSLPLPLTISPGSQQNLDNNSSHWCAFVAWDKSVSQEGCRAAANSITDLLKSYNNYTDELVRPTSNEINPSDIFPDSRLNTRQLVLANEFSLLSHLNLQTYTQSDWNHTDLSSVLVMLVDACDKRDFQPVVECILRCNRSRRDRIGEELGVELNCYITMLYLSRYQCTSAFHRFFPTTARSCKGYHFWCPNGTLSIFDRLFRNAVDKVKKNSDEPIPSMHRASDVALGFRSVFGHII